LVPKISFRARKLREDLGVRKFYFRGGVEGFLGGFDALKIEEGEAGGGHADRSGLGEGPLDVIGGDLLG
jgi:hypothetical protein